MPDLTEHGLKSLRKAVDLIESGKANRVDLGHDTIVYKVPTKDENKFTIRIDMKINKEEE